MPDTLLLPTSALELFSRDYSQARKILLQQIHALPHPYQHLPIQYPALGPAGDILYTDCVWIGKPGAAKTLVLISATHGVEGFAGSAVQADFLQRLPTNIRYTSDTAILIIHALNPWGFAWLRRCDHENIDLNRNFIDFSQPLPDNAGYRQLAPYLVPLNDHWQAADHQLEQFRIQHGQRTYETAVSGGQYSDPEGPFYGGHAPAAARLLIEKLIQTFNLHTRQLAVIDIHSGLGPFGYGEIICDHPSNSGYLQTARQWYGHSVTEPAAGTSNSVPKQGLLDFAWQAIMQQTNSCFITLEFGTFSTAALFQVIRQDHFLHTHNKPLNWSAGTTQHIKQMIRHHFYPETRDWKEMVLLRARQVIDQAISGLKHEPYQ